MSNDPEDDPGRQSSRRAIPRRTVLRGAGAGLLAAGLAGCSGTQERRYEAAPASLSPEAEALGFESEDDEWTEVRRTKTVADRSVEVTLRNYGAAYDGDPIGLGVGATPTAEEGGRELNPVATASFRELLTGEVGAPLREQVDLGVDADVEWTRGPEELPPTEGDLLDRGVEVKTFVGTTDEPEAVLLHLARTIHDADAVFVGGGRSRSIDADDDRPLLAEEGWFTPAQLDAGLELFVDALPLVIREEMTTLLHETETEATETGSDGDGDDSFLRARVLDTQGRDLENVTVEIQEQSSGSTVASGTTDQQGLYGPVQVTGDRDYTVTADDRGYSTDSRNVYVGTGETKQADLVLEKLTGHIVGIVTDTNANRIEAADVEAIAKPTGNTVRTTTSNAQGEYSFDDLPAETTYTIRGDAPGYEPFTVDEHLKDGYTEDVNVVLKKQSGDLVGLVYDDSMDPIADADVEVVSMRTGSVIGSATSDSRGAYSISDLPATVHEVRADARGHAPDSMDVVIQENDQTQANFFLQPLLGTITGTVTDANANPIADADVAVVSTATGSTVATTTTDASGQYTVTDLLAETTYRVEANKSGYDPGSAEGAVIHGGTTQVDVVLTANAVTPRFR